MGCFTLVSYRNKYFLTEIVDAKEAEADDEVKKVTATGEIKIEKINPYYDLGSKKTNI